MQVEEQKTNEGMRYDVMLTERRVEDLQVLQKYGRKDEMPFRAVEATSEALASAYETFVHPARRGDGDTHRCGREAPAMHPQRAQRWAVSDLNPFLWPLKGMADMVRANRAPRDNDGPMAAMEHWTAAMTSASLDLYRDLRDAAAENTFFRTYGPASIGMAAQDKDTVAEEPVDARNAPLVKEALSHIEDGDRDEAIVRTALLLMKAGTGRRRLSAMKRARELVGKDIGLVDMTAEAARGIIREQSYIVDFEPVKALMALPKLLRTSEDRRRLLDLLDRLEGQIEANAKQVTLLGEIRRLLSGGRDRRQLEEQADHGDAAGEPHGPPQGDGEAGHRPSIRRHPTHEGKLMNDQPTELPKAAIQSKILHGKRALVIGIANEHSIAYGCARVFRQLGADLAVTYLTRRPGPYVEPLAKELGASIFAPRLPPFSSRPATWARRRARSVFRQIRETWGGLDIALHSIAFAPKEDLQGRLLDSSSEGFKVAMDISCHSFIRMARLGRTLDDRGRDASRDELSRRQQGRPELQPHGSGESGTGERRSLSRL